MNTVIINESINIAMSHLENNDTKAARPYIDLLNKLPLEGVLAEKREELRKKVAAIETVDLLERIESKLQRLKAQQEDQPSIRTETTISGGRVGMVVGYSSGTINTQEPPRTVRQGNDSTYIEQRTVVQGKGSSYIQGDVTTYQGVFNQSSINHGNSQPSNLKVLETLTAESVSSSVSGDTMYLFVVVKGQARIIHVKDGECVIINGTTYAKSVNGTINQSFSF